MAGEKNTPARRNPTGQELDRQYDELHQGTGQHGSHQGHSPGGAPDTAKAAPGRKPTGQEMDQQYDDLHPAANADAPPPA